MLFTYTSPIISSDLLSQQLNQSSNLYIVTAIIISSLATFFLRALPFVLIKKIQKYRREIDFLATLMPAGIMFILALYCLFFSVKKNTLPEITVSILALGSLVISEKYLHKPILSIVLGMLVYIVGQNLLPILI